MPLEHKPRRNYCDAIVYSSPADRRRWNARILRRRNGSARYDPADDGARAAHRGDSTDLDTRSAYGDDSADRDNLTDEGARAAYPDHIANCGCATFPSSFRRRTTEIEPG